MLSRACYASDEVSFRWSFYIYFGTLDSKNDSKRTFTMIYILSTEPNSAERTIALLVVIPPSNKVQAVLYSG